MDNKIRELISGQFGKVINVLHEGYILVDEDANIIDTNPAYCKMIGYSKDELLSMDLHKVRPGMTVEYQKEFIQKVIEEGSVEFETQHRKKSGKMIDLKATAGVLNVGGTNYLAGFIRDITDQKEAERKLEETSGRFRSLFKHNPNPVYYFDLEGNFQGCNEKLVEFTGYSREEILEVGFSHFVVEEDLERTWEHFKKAASGIPGEYEISVKVKAGFKNIRVTKFPIYVEKKITGVYGILQDITKQQQAQKKLQESEQRFKSLFEHNPNAVYSFDLEGNFVMANEELGMLTGYSIEELIHTNFEPLTQPEDRDRVWKHYEKAAKGEAQKYEAAGIHKKGYKVYFSITNLPIYVGGEIIGVFGIAQDITEQKELSQKLLKSEQRWEHLVKNNPQPVQVTVDGDIVFINEAGAQLYGAKTPEEITGMSVFSFSHPDHKAKIKERKYQLENGLDVKKIHEHKILRLDGETRYIEVHSIPIQYQEEKAIQTVIHDITDRKIKEQIIKKSLKEKEVLLKEIHHRVKNNMAVVSGLLQLQAMSAEDEALKESLRQSQLRIFSMAMIHEKLYQTETLSEISFAKYIKELVVTIKETLAGSRKDIGLAFELAELSLSVNQAIPCALIINEVVVNSFKYAFEGKEKGTICVSLQKEGSEIIIKVKDDGIGLPKDFAIKKQKSLGMTLIQTLVGQLNGKAEYGKPGNGAGAEFSVRFKLQNN